MNKIIGGAAVTIISASVFAGVEALVPHENAHFVINHEKDRSVRLVKSNPSVRKSGKGSCKGIYVNSKNRHTLELEKNVSSVVTIEVRSQSGNADPTILYRPVGQGSSLICKNRLSGAVEIAYLKMPPGTYSIWIGNLKVSEDIYQVNININK